MKLEVGMYVRTKRGTFDRFITSHKNESLTWYTFEDRGNITNPENYIIKASHNIIDLIEVGDYVNGREVAYIDEFGKYIAICETDITTRDFEGRYEFKKIKEQDIKSIVTKEQFESMSYKVGE